MKMLLWEMAIPNAKFFIIWRTYKKYGSAREIQIATERKRKAARERARESERERDIKKNVDWFYLQMDERVLSKHTQYMCCMFDNKKKEICSAILPMLYPCSPAFVHSTNRLLPDIFSVMRDINANWFNFHVVLEGYGWKRSVEKKRKKRSKHTHTHTTISHRQDAWVVECIRNT